MIILLRHDCQWLKCCFFKSFHAFFVFFLADNATRLPAVSESGTAPDGDSEDCRRGPHARHGQPRGVSAARAERRRRPLNCPPACPKDQPCPNTRTGPVSGAGSCPVGSNSPKRGSSPLNSTRGTAGNRERTPLAESSNSRIDPPSGGVSGQHCRSRIPTRRRAGCGRGVPAG